MRSERMVVNTSWSMLSKKPLISPSINHLVLLNVFCMLQSAVCGLLCGLKPWEEFSKLPSYIASKIIRITSCKSLSMNDGIPNGRIFPFFLGIYTRWEGFGWYVSSLSASINRSTWDILKPSMVLPSTPFVILPCFA